jgi:hypothetical protein
MTQPWCEVTLVLTVAYTFEGIMDATSLHWTCRFVTTIRKLLLYYQQKRRLPSNLHSLKEGIVVLLYACQLVGFE